MSRDRLRRSHPIVLVKYNFSMGANSTTRVTRLQLFDTGMCIWPLPTSNLEAKASINPLPVVALRSPISSFDSTGEPPRVCIDFDLNQDLNHLGQPRDSESQPSPEFEGPLKVTIERGKTSHVIQNFKLFNDSEMSHWSSSYSGHPEDHFQSHSDSPSAPSSSLPPPQPLQRDTGLPASSLTYAVDNGSYTHFRSQSELTYGSQRQYGVVAPNTSHVQDPASSSFQTSQSHLQVSMGSAFQRAVANRLHHNPFELAQTGPNDQPLFQTSPNPAFFDPSTRQADFTYGSRNPQHAAAGSQHQHETFDIGSAPNAAAYPNYPTLGSQLQVSTGSASQEPDAAASRLHHGFLDLAQNAPQEIPLFPSSQALDPISFNSRDIHDESAPQSAPQGPALFPTDLNPTLLNPSMSQADPYQPSSSALGAYRSYDPDSLYSEDHLAKMGQKRLSYRKITRSYKGVPFIRSSTPLPSASSHSTRRTSTLQVESALIDSVKQNASKSMNSSLFLSSLYPTPDEVDNLAIAALKEKELNVWKKRDEGQRFLSRLKGTVKKIHRDSSQDCARGLVTGAYYYLSLQLLFANTDEIATSRRTHASGMLLNYDFLDTIVQRVMSDGQLKSFRVPFGNASVIGMTEYILVDQAYRQYLSLDGPDWALGIRNTLLLAATICKWKIRQCSKNGWFRITDFHISENEASHEELKTRMSSLQGVRIAAFSTLSVLPLIQRSQDSRYSIADWEDYYSQATATEEKDTIYKCCADDRIRGTL
ncbi:hypothetical protein C8R48DRAFT_679496 [Suillus tomentosus]|nr:hypothetical protein C8R48DRAFT_679496 [Suillus tomentosus]